MVEKNLTEQEKLYNNIKKFVNDKNLQGVVDIVDDERGVAMQAKR